MKQTQPKPLYMARCMGMLALVLLMGRPSQAQSTDWTPLFKHKGVDFQYILHKYGDGDNDGVVVKVINTNAYPVTYRFKMIFKSNERVRVTVPAQGRLKPGEMKTGGLSGLWWIPFKDGAPITEIGMRGFKVTKASK